MANDVDKICNTLTNDFNTDILDTVDPGIRDMFKDTAEKFKDGKEGNIPLLNAIHNHFSGVLPTPSFISGPLSLTYHKSDEYNMNIYIFGEIHNAKQNCKVLKKSNYMDISEYLQKLFLNSDKFIDFYLEDFMFRTLSVGRKAFLNSLRTDFTMCLNPESRSKCVFKTLRTHFVDIRRIHTGSSLFVTTQIEKAMLYLLKKTNDDSDYLQVIKDLSELNSYKKIASYILDTIDNISILQKELDRSLLDRELIISAFRDIKKWRSLFRKNISHKDIRKILRIIQAPIVDIYTISRMFKSFKKTNYFPQTPKNIIYYAGDSHSTVARKFLEKLKFKKMLSIRSGANSKRCLKMSETILDFK